MNSKASRNPQNPVKEFDYLHIHKKIIDKQLWKLEANSISFFTLSAFLYGPVTSVGSFALRGGDRSLCCIWSTTSTNVSGTCGEIPPSTGPSQRKASSERAGHMRERTTGRYFCLYWLSQGQRLMYLLWLASGKVHSDFCPMPSPWSTSLLHVSNIVE